MLTLGWGSSPHPLSGSPLERLVGALRMGKRLKRFLSPGFQTDRWYKSFCSYIGGISLGKSLCSWQWECGLSA